MKVIEHEYNDRGAWVKYSHTGNVRCENCASENAEVAHAVIIVLGLLITTAIIIGMMVWAAS